MKSASVSLADITDLLTDGTHYTPPDIGAGIPFLTVRDISENGLDFENCSKISDDEYELAKRQNSSPRTGDILFSKDGTVGKVHLVRENRKFAVLSSLAILRPSSDVDAAYLAHFLRTSSALEAAGSKKTGSAIRRIVLRDLATLKVPLPPLDEQRRIAAILDKADALRRKRKRALELTRAASDAFFEATVHRYADGKVQFLGECLDFVTTGGRNWSQYYSNKGRRFIRSLDVQMNEVSDVDMVYVEAPDSAEARRTCTRRGDVLLTVTGSRIGRAVALPESLVGSYVSQHVAILRPKPQFLSSIFLGYFLASRNGQRQIEKWQYGQTKPGLNFKQIENFEIPRIKITEQHMIEITIRRIEGFFKTQALQEDRLQSLFFSLQKRAFSGQI